MGHRTCQFFQRHFSQVSFSFATVTFKVMMIKQEKKCVITYVPRRNNKLTTETSNEQYLIWNVNINGFYFHFRSLQIVFEKNIKLFNSISIFFQLLQV